MDIQLDYHCGCERHALGLPLSGVRSSAVAASVPSRKFADKVARVSADGVSGLDPALLIDAKYHAHAARSSLPTGRMTTLAAIARSSQSRWNFSNCRCSALM